MKRLLKMVLVLVLSIGLTACGAKPTAISAIAEQVVSVGGTLTLTPKLVFAEEGVSEEEYQKRVDKLKIVYMSDSSGIASVDENGVVTGIEAGYANVTIQAGEVFTSVSIIVVPALTDISLEKEIALVEGQNTILEISAIPKEAILCEPTFKIEDESIASISIKGSVYTVSALSEGETTLSVVCGSITKTIAVTVKPKIERISFEKTSGTLLVGAKFQLTPIILPEKIDPNEIFLSWESSNSGVASVDKEGNIKALSIGETVISVKVEGYPALEAAYTLTVKKAPNPVGSSSGSSGNGAGTGGTGGGNAESGNTTAETPDHPPAPTPQLTEEEQRLKAQYPEYDPAIDGHVVEYRGDGWIVLHPNGMYVFWRDKNAPDPGNVNELPDL
ncbi:Ig-like domain-containing protein [Ruminococcaceae bacterium OttesenSCG-928-A16]|nr:Ig-like domain-containing protein [Ruminococcaceae bacterium OttesenSCG-928-A16]